MFRNVSFSGFPLNLLLPIQRAHPTSGRLTQPSAGSKETADLTAQLKVSDGALDFIRKMLELDPEKRPSSLDPREMLHSRTAGWLMLTCLVTVWYWLAGEIGLVYLDEMEFESLETPL